MTPTRSRVAAPFAAVASVLLLALMTACSGGDAGSGEGQGAGPDDEAQTEPAAGADTIPDGAAARRTDEEAVPCRCMERDLAGYFEDADQVMMGRLVSSGAAGGDMRLGFELVERPWKMADPAAALPVTGDTVYVVTAQSSASCGIEASSDAVYALFAESDGRALRVTSCGGTRVHLADGMEAQGFEGVPGDAVVRQLDALAGLDVIRESTAATPEEDDPTSEALVGMVELPALSDGSAVALRASPDETAPLSGTVDAWVDVAAFEVGYEVPAAVVVARVEGWYRIRLADGSFGWVSPTDAGSWTPFEELPVRSLAYLTEAWSGYVWPEIGAGIPTRSARKGNQDREEYPAEVHEARRIGGSLWFRVSVLADNPCETTGTVSAELTGWIPAYGPDGEPAVWYYSRGC